MIIRSFSTAVIGFVSATAFIYFYLVFQWLIANTIYADLAEGSCNWSGYAAAQMFMLALVANVIFALRWHLCQS